MATARIPPEWYNETHTYLVHGGPVESSTDGQVHHVDASGVARLYGLPTSLPNVILFASLARAMEHRDAQVSRATAAWRIAPAIHIIGPRSDGDYTVPESVQTHLASRRVHEGATLRYIGSGGLGPGPHTVRIDNAATGDSEYVQATRLAFASLVRSGAGNAAIAAGETMRRFADVVRGVGLVPGLGVEASRTNMDRNAPTPVSVEAAQAWVKASTAPEEGSRAWIRIVKKGCVGERGLSGDFACNDYAWGCDSCPVVVDRMQRESALEKSIKGNRMHRFWRAKAKVKNEIDCKSPKVVGIDPASPGSDQTVIVGWLDGKPVRAKRRRKD